MPGPGDEQRRRQRAEHQPGGAITAVDQRQPADRQRRQRVGQLRRGRRRQQQADREGAPRRDPPLFRIDQQQPQRRRQQQRRQHIVARDIGAEQERVARGEQRRPRAGVARRRAGRTRAGIDERHRRRAEHGIDEPQHRKRPCTGQRRQRGEQQRLQRRLQISEVAVRQSAARQHRRRDILAFIVIERSREGQQRQQQGEASQRPPGGKAGQTHGLPFDRGMRQSSSRTERPCHEPDTERAQGTSRAKGGCQ